MTSGWPRDAILTSVILVMLILVAWSTRVWVITAVPIGFLFGFLLQKGDLCGASAFSEVVLSRDLRKAFGLWVAKPLSRSSAASSSGSEQRLGGDA